MKNTLKRFSPKQEDINLGWLNKHLHNPDLWKWNKRTISKAFAVGLFCAFLPLPLHTLLAAALAVAFSSNILLSIGLVWLNNPLTMVPIYYYIYKLGSYIIGTEIDPNFQFTIDYFMGSLTSTITAIWVGGLIISTITAIIGYTAILAIYKYKAYQRVKRWK
ncbi:MAG TPA: DUF2062 domain-containing protein [Gammaproteobacteria bacterium]|nr:DUF2062 domain-containing protein [Gammaproteobacteria bacterium]